MTSNEDVQVFEAEPVDADANSAGRNNYAGAFVHSFGHTLIQGPIDGVREVVNKLSGSSVVPKVEVVKAPEKAPISSPEWEAQKFGTGAGIVAGLLLVAKLLSRR